VDLAPVEIQLLEITEFPAQLLLEEQMQVDEFSQQIKKI